MKRSKGLFITFEGSEGSGKSTQAKLVHEYLMALGRDVILIREPGAVPISEAIRKILLDVNNKGMSDICETLLYMAARAQLVEEVIEPALKRGVIVLSDRFLDSTVVYQGYGNGVDLKFIRSLGRHATKNIMPDLTFIFDLDTRKGLARKETEKDRIELRSIQYHNRVRRGYQAIARQEPRRVHLLRVDGNQQVIFERVRYILDKVLERR